MMTLYSWLENSSFSIWVREAPTIWAFAMIITMHTFGMGVLVGASSVVDLRLLGIARGIPLGSMRPMFKIMWFGFWLNLVTGSILFAADATTRGTSWLFLIKMLLVGTGVATIVLIRRNLYGEDDSVATPVINDGARRLAVVSLLTWFAAVTAGRLLAYIQV
jgi:hypothetical protein